MEKRDIRQSFNIFRAENAVFVENLLKNCKKLLFDDDENDIKNQEIEFPDVKIDQNLTCRLCKISNFDSFLDQREHYQSDWHKFNLNKKLKKANFEPLNELEFENYVSDEDSSSEEEESENFDRQLLRHLNTTGRSFFVSHDDQVFSCFKAILEDGQISRNSNFTIMALAGGHFAAAYFEKEKIILHKTLHRYVVRAKQGGSQGSRDNKQSQNKPKSAGANLRRYNEILLCKDVEDLLEEWADKIQKSNLIFLRYPSYHKKLFFRSGNDEQLFKLDKNDQRVRNIPFNTKKPTLQEMERIHKKLCCITLHGPREQFLENLKLENQVSQRMTEKAKPVAKTKKNVDSNENDDYAEIEISDDDSERRKLGSKKSKDVVKENDVMKNEVINSLTDDQIRNLYTCLKTGDCDRLKLVIDQILDKGVTKASIIDYLNQPFSIPNLPETTHLHSACSAGFTSLVEFLLNFGCDPTITDSKNRTAYHVASSKAIRQSLEVFRRDNESKISVDFDWSKSRIPVMNEKSNENLPISEEEMEKIRQKKKAKAEKQKLKKQEKQALEKELEDKARFLALSDREKRALAAEKRLLASRHEEKPPVLSRCFQCGEDISGRIPFEYSNFVFCTTKCLNLHRKKNAG